MATSLWQKISLPYVIVNSIHKKGNKQITTNYRSIFLLLILSKVYENIIFLNVYNYFASNG